MLKTVLLICSTATNPDPATCTYMTALDVASFPPERTTMCGMIGESTLARTALRPEPGKSYAKIICEPVREALR